MKAKLLKPLMVVSAICLQLSTFSSVYASSGGAIAGGGGDATEIRVDEIRSDILNWINQDGAKELNLPSNMTYEKYVKQMKNILEPKKVIVSFLEKDDRENNELQVNVNGVPKTCRGFISTLDLLPHIICNISRFENTSESKQYELIHHEFAGLVNVENNIGAASDYFISSQITDYLTEQTVLKLSVKGKGKRILDYHEELPLIVGQKHLKFLSYDIRYAKREGELFDVGIMDIYSNGNLKLHFIRDNDYDFHSKVNVFSADPNLCVKTNKGGTVCVNDKVLVNFLGYEKECNVDSVMVTSFNSSYFSKKLTREVAVYCEEPETNPTPVKVDIDKLILKK